MEKHSEEALRLKTLAEQSYTASNLTAAATYAAKAHRLCPTLDGLSEMLTAFKILSTSSTDWYGILQVEPFSTFNVIKKQYRKLALTLHPDKNAFGACEEAFKVVAEGFRVLSDKGRRRVYDAEVRLRIQEEVTRDDVDLFRTLCLECGVECEFDRKYLGCDLVCRGCNKSFRALEVDGSEGIAAASGREMLRAENGEMGSKGGVLKSKRGLKEVVEVNNREDGTDIEGERVPKSSARVKARGVSSRVKNGELGSKGGVLKSKRGLEEVVEVKNRGGRRDKEEGSGPRSSARIQTRGVSSWVKNGELGKKGGILKCKGEVGKGVSDELSKMAIGEDGEMTLAEMQMLVKERGVSSRVENGELGNKGGILKSKGEVSKGVSDELSKRATGEGGEITLAEMQLLVKKRGIGVGASFEELELLKLERARNREVLEVISREHMRREEDASVSRTSARIRARNEGVRLKTGNREFCSGEEEITLAEMHKLEKRGATMGSSDEELKMSKLKRVGNREVLEVNDKEDSRHEDGVIGSRDSAIIRARNGGVRLKTRNREFCSGEEEITLAEMQKLEKRGATMGSSDEELKMSKLKRAGNREMLEVNDKEDTRHEDGVIGSRASARIRARNGGVSSRKENDEFCSGEEGITLAEMQKLEKSGATMESSDVELEISKLKMAENREVLEVNDREDTRQEEDVIGSRASARIRDRNGRVSSRKENDEFSSGEEGITLAKMQKLEKRGANMGSSDEELEISKLKRAGNREVLEVNDREDTRQEEDVIGTRTSARIRARNGGVSSRKENDEFSSGEEGIPLAEMQKQEKRGLLIESSDEEMEISKLKRARNREVLEVNGREDIRHEEDVIGSRTSARIRARNGGVSLRKENDEFSGGEEITLAEMHMLEKGVVTGSSDEELEISKLKRARISKVFEVNDREDIRDEGDAIGSRTSARIRARNERVRWRVENGEGSSGEEGIALAEMQNLEKRGRVMRSSDEELELSTLKRAKTCGKRVTLAEMQMRAKKKMREEKMRLRVKEKPKKGEKAKRNRSIIKFDDSDDEDYEPLAVEDSDFYDFDKDGVERSFKRGQVWAFYDDGDDRMPRHYGLIDQVSMYPFKIKLSRLEPQNNAEDGLLNLEKFGVRTSCGKFKVANTKLIHSADVFSHLVDAERAAREVYRVYPKKGSVWALFNEKDSQNKDETCYDIVVCLTSYDEVYGLSMAYLEKVEGFKSVFKRRDMGCHAIKSLQECDFQLFSHQVPARKLIGEEAPDLSKDCWVLDPASLPPEQLKIGWRK